MSLSQTLIFEIFSAALFSKKKLLTFHRLECLSLWWYNACYPRSIDETIRVGRTSFELCAIQFSHRRSESLELLGLSPSISSISS